MNDLTNRSGSRITSGRVGVALGVVALTFSLGVPSQAAKVINGSALKNNSVTTQKIKNNNLTGTDVKQDSLTGADIKEASLKGVLKPGDVAAFGAASSASIDNFTSAGFTSVIDKSFTAPANGFLYITGSISAEDDGSFAGGGWLFYRLSLDGASLTASQFAHELDNRSANQAGSSGAVTGVVPVTKGAHTVSLDAVEFGTGSFIIGRDVSVLFVRDGSGFLPPAKVKVGRAARPQGRQAP
ncbi:hypothetical protein BH11ACT8_BH11ACT8_29060 [soil metagenome]